MGTCKRKLTCIMNQLEGYVKVHNKNKVCKFIEIIHGFKQISHVWYK